jgi:hypothetical protein
VKRLCVCFSFVLVFIVGMCYALAGDGDLAKYSNYVERVVVLKDSMIVSSDVSTMNYVNHLLSTEKFKNVEVLRQKVEDTLGAKPIVLPRGTKLYVSSAGVTYGVDSQYVVVHYFTTGLPHCVGLGKDLLTKAVVTSNRVRPEAPDIGCCGNGGSGKGIPIGVFLPDQPPPTWVPPWTNGPREVGPGYQKW